MSDDFFQDNIFVVNACYEKVLLSDKYELIPGTTKYMGKYERSYFDERRGGVERIDCFIKDGQQIKYKIRLDGSFYYRKIECDPTGEHLHQPESVDMPPSYSPEDSPPSYYQKYLKYKLKYHALRDTLTNSIMRDL